MLQSTFNGHTLKPIPTPSSGAVEPPIFHTRETRNSTAAAAPPPFSLPKAASFPVHLQYSEYHRSLPRAYPGIRNLICVVYALLPLHLNLDQVDVARTLPLLLR